MSRYTDLTLQNGYVFYNRLGYPEQAGMWVNLYKKISKVPLESFATEEIQQMGTELKTLGKKELEKEVKLISKISEKSYDPDKFLSNPRGLLELIELLNGLINIREVYENTLRKLDLQKGKNRAVNPSSSFYNYFIRNLQKTVAEGKARENAYLGVNWEIRIKNAIEKSFKDVLKARPSNTEEERIWADLLEEYKFVRKEVNQQLWGILNDKGQMDELLIELEKKEKDQKYFLQITDKSPSRERVIRRVGGFAQEHVEALITSQTIKKSSSHLSQKLTVRGKALKSNALSSDVMTIVDVKGQTNLDAIFKEIDAAGGERIKATKILRQAVGKLSGVNDSFVIYESVKNYGLGKSFRGFSISSRVSTPEKLRSFLLENTDFSAARVENFIAQILNVMSGAIYEGKREDIRNNLSILLSRAVGQLLFDDFEEKAGELAQQGSATAIHIFSLSGVKVPLSYLLMKIGDTFLELSNEVRKGEIINASIKSKGVEIMFPSPIKDITPAQDIYWYWDLQRDRAQKQSIISGRFMSRFKELLRELQSI